VCVEVNYKPTPNEGDRVRLPDNDFETPGNQGSNSLEGILNPNKNV
jgi:hypothetical protein